MICLFNLRVMDSASSRSFVGEVSCLPKTKTPDTGIPFLKLTAKAPKNRPFAPRGSESSSNHPFSVDM